MSSAFRGVPDIEAMNLIGFDAMLLGNHEFDFGIDYMDLLENLANFPVLSTNLVGTYNLGVEAAVLTHAVHTHSRLEGVTARTQSVVSEPHVFERLTLSDP